MPTPMLPFLGVMALAGGLVLAAAAMGRAASPARRILGYGTGVLFGSLALGVFSITWPLDWVRAGPIVSATFRASGYELRYVQYPGEDFYSDVLEVASGETRRARIYLNVDNYKCWYGAITQAGDRATFACLPFGGRSTISTDWLETQLQDCGHSDCDLSSVFYEWMGMQNKSVSPKVPNR
jgi:hypothetical protein